MEFAEGGDSRVDVFEGEVGSFGAVATDPAHGGGVEAIRLAVTDDKADLERVVEVRSRGSSAAAARIRCRLRVLIARRKRA